MAVRKMKKWINEAAFHLMGKKPWARGYQEYKDRKINEVVHANVFDAKQVQAGYGFRIDERIVEYPWFLSLLPSGPGKLLDAGSILNYDFILRHRKLQDKQIFISTLAPENQCYWQNKISYVYEDLRESHFKDACFDWVVSLSTIEHIGLDNTLLYTSETSKNETAGATCLEAVREYHRMLKPGGVLFLSFPFGKHKNHGWFQIFDAEMLDDVILAFCPASYEEYHYRYEADGWKNSSREASKEATYFDIHTQKTYDTDLAAASRAIVCLRLVK